MYLFLVRLSIWVRISEAPQINKVTKESILYICSIDALIAESDFVRISRFKWHQEAARGISIVFPPTTYIIRRIPLGRVVVVD